MKEHGSIKDAGNLFITKWFFFASFTALGFLQLGVSAKNLLIIAVSIGLMLVLINPTRRMFCLEKKAGTRVKLAALASSVGICWKLAECSAWIKYPTSHYLKALGNRLTVLFGFSAHRARTVIVLLIAVCALYSIYVLCCAFFEKLIKILRKNGCFEDVSRGECWTYLVIFTLSITALSLVYAKTDVFFQTKSCVSDTILMDVIYTSDTTDMIKSGMFFRLDYYLNQLYQALFPVFAAPFMGFASLIAHVLPFISNAEAFLTGYTQVALLLFANYFLAKTLYDKPWKRVCFVLCTVFSYSYMLFGLLIEQYVVSYFYLILLVCPIIQRRKVDDILMVGAAGTLLPSAAMASWASEHYPLREPLKWFIDMLRWVGKYLLALVICLFPAKYLSLRSDASFITGIMTFTYSWKARTLQFVSFIRDCLFAPSAGVQYLYDSMYDLLTLNDPVKAEQYKTGAVLPNHYGWQLNAVRSLQWIGVLILVLMIVSVVINRKKRSVRIATYWSLISIAVLVVTGWGLTENGLVLYALYFGWSYLMLLFELLNTVAEKLKKLWMIPAVTAAFAVTGVFVNIPAIAAIVRFGQTYYPM